MKVILYLCLVAPLVFGSAIPAESEVDVNQAYKFLHDYLAAPTDEQKKCVEDAVKNIKEANPDLEWWFNDLKKLVNDVKSRHDKCKSIHEKPEKLKCYLALKDFVNAQLSKMIKSLLEVNKRVLVQLMDAIQKCFQSARI